MDSRVIAQLVVHLGRIASGDGLVTGLTPGQWAMVRYFARANRFSQTPSAFAAFHGTTRGTASQAIKSFVGQVNLRQTRSNTDGLSVRLDLMNKARAILAKEPLDVLARAADDLPPGVRGQFSNGLQRLLGRMTSETGKPSFGTCKNCAHFEDGPCCQEGLTPYACGFVNKPLVKEDLHELCVNFAAGKAAPERTLSVRVM